MNNNKRKRDKYLKEDNRLYEDITNKQHKSKELTQSRSKQDYHRKVFQNSQIYRKQTDVLTNSSIRDDINSEQYLDELNNFDQVTRVEDFPKFDPKLAKYICSVDDTFKLKFNTLDQFDIFFSKERAQGIDVFFTKFHDTNRKAINHSRIFKALKHQDIQIKNQNEYKLANTKIDAILDEFKMDEYIRESKEAKQRVNKYQIKSNFMKDKQNKKKIHLQEKIQMQVLWLRGYPYKKIAKITGQSVNCIGVNIHRTRQNEHSKKLNPQHVVRKQLDPETINALFKQLDNYYGNDNMQQVCQRQLKVNFNIDAKKSYVQSLLRQGNFSRMMGNKCSKDEVFNKEKQRHQLFNLQMMSIIQKKSFNVQVLDEFGVQCNSSGKFVIARKGRKKDKFQQKQDIKVNVAFTMGPNGVFTFQMGKQGFVASIFEYQYHQTLDAITEANSDQAQAYLILDNASSHEHLPLKKYTELKGADSHCKVLTFQNSGQFSKVSPVERLISIVKLRLSKLKYTNQNQCKNSIASILKKIDQNDIKSVYRRCAIDWKQQLKNIYSRVYQDNFK